MKKEYEAWKKIRTEWERGREETGQATFIPTFYSEKNYVCLCYSLNNLYFEGHIDVYLLDIMRTKILKEVRYRGIDSKYLAERNAEGAKVQIAFLKRMMQESR